MLLIDVNVLVYAHREDSPNHPAFLAWLTDLVQGETAFGISDVVLSGFLRITTHPKVFDPPSPLEHALRFVEELRASPNYQIVTPGPRHWRIFTQLCRDTGAVGNLIPDAYLAAMAIEVDAEWITTDRDFKDFPGLRWRHPLS